MAYQWPSDVPHQQSREGSSVPEPYRSPKTVETEAGVQIMRREPGPRASMIAWQSIPLTEAHWESLEKFFRITLMEGTLTFSMPIYRLNQGYVNRRCQLVKGKFTADTSKYPLIYVSFNLIVFNY